MPELANYTPFPNFRYYSLDAEGEEFGIVIVKGTFQIGPDGVLVPGEEQAPMMFTDACFGEVNVSSLWHPSDLVPHKPGTDVIVNAVAHAPDREPATDWLCGVRVSDEGGPVAQKTLRVTGPRHWQPKWKRDLREDEESVEEAFDGWELTEPETATSVELRYENAFGGEIEIGRDDNDEPIFETSHENPIGRGLLHRDVTDRTQPVPVPQIEAPDEPIADPYARPAPQSLGAIPPAWLPRRPKGGTYDQAWMDEVWPNWPADYDFAYHQSAHPDLILDRYLTGDELVELKGLAAGGDVAFALPGLQMAVQFSLGEEHERTDANLDTVLIDATATDPLDWRVFLSWRCRFEPERWDRAAILMPDASASEEELAA